MRFSVLSLAMTSGGGALCASVKGFRSIKQRYAATGVGSSKAQAGRSASVNQLAVF